MLQLEVIKALDSSRSHFPYIMESSGSVSDPITGFRKSEISFRKDNEVLCDSH